MGGSHSTRPLTLLLQVEMASWSFPPGGDGNPGWYPGCRAKIRVTSLRDPPRGGGEPGLQVGAGRDGHRSSPRGKAGTWAMALKQLDRFVGRAYPKDKASPVAGVPSWKKSFCFIMNYVSVLYPISKTSWEHRSRVPEQPHRARDTITGPPLRVQASSTPLGEPQHLGEQ